MKKLIIFTGALLLLVAGIVGFFAIRPMTAQEALILKNVEAIARGENGGGIVIKNCYGAFHPNKAGNDYYATCSGAQNGDIMYQCGAVSIFEPLWGVTAVYQCWEPVY